MWELVIAALPCGGSPGFLGKLGMMGVWHYTPIISTEARA